MNDIPAVVLNQEVIDSLTSVLPRLPSNSAKSSLLEAAKSSLLEVRRGGSGTLKTPFFSAESAVVVDFSLEALSASGVAVVVTSSAGGLSNRSTSCARNDKARCKITIYCPY